MSYDLAVYVSRPASRGDLESVVAAGARLQLEGDEGSLTVVRGARRTYSFTLEGPDDLEPEDVPEDVAAVLLEPRHLYGVLVEGSSDLEVVHAVRFARRLARALDGAVVDQQTDELWTRSRSRAVVRPAREERIAVVSLDWLCLAETLTPNPAELFLDVVRETVPEALPRRFGTYEPLQGKWADAGADGFINTWRSAEGSVFTDGTLPCVGGLLSERPDVFADDTWGMTLSFLAEPVRAPAWREALKKLFVQLADGFPAFWATADVERDWIWSGRSLAADHHTDSSTSPMRLQGWTGFPGRPAWWTWLGEPMAEYHRLLPPDMTTSTSSGVLYESATDPMEAHGAPPLSHWLPPSTFSTPAPNKLDVWPAPVTTALDMPQRMRDLQRNAPEEG